MKTLITYAARFDCTEKYAGSIWGKRRKNNCE